MREKIRQTAANFRDFVDFRQDSAKVDPNDLHPVNLFEFDGFGVATYRSTSPMAFLYKGKRVEIPAGNVFSAFRFSSKTVANCSEMESIRAQISGLQNFLICANSIENDTSRSDHLLVPKYLIGVADREMAELSTRLGFVITAGDDEKGYQLAGEINHVERKLYEFHEATGDLFTEELKVAATGHPEMEVSEVFPVYSISTTRVATPAVRKKYQVETEDFKKRNRNRILISGGIISTLVGGLYLRDVSSGLVATAIISSRLALDKGVRDYVVSILRKQK